MDKPVESISKCHFNRGGRQQQQSLGSKKPGIFRSQSSVKSSNLSNNTSPCSNCGTKHAKNQCIPSGNTCFKCNKVGHFALVCRSSSSSTQNTRQFNRFHGIGRAPCDRGFTPRRQINEATEMSDTPVKSYEKSDLDAVKLMEAYGLSNTSPQNSLKQRVQIDDISVGIDICFENTVNSTDKEFTLPVLHGAPIEHNVCTEWYTVKELEPIPSHIGNHCIQMEANIPTDWSVDALLQTTGRTIHLTEVDSVTSDSVYTHVTLNDEICQAKLDTGAQINMMTETLFKHIGKVNKMPLFPKSDMKLVSYANRNIEYIGTTVLDVSHLIKPRKQHSM